MLVAKSTPSPHESSQGRNVIQLFDAATISCTPSFTDDPGAINAKAQQSLCTSFSRKEVSGLSYRSRYPLAILRHCKFRPTFFQNPWLHTIKRCAYRIRG